MAFSATNFCPVTLRLAMRTLPLSKPVHDKLPILSASPTYNHGLPTSFLRMAKQWVSDVPVIRAHANDEQFNLLLVLDHHTFSAARGRPRQLARSGQQQYVATMLETLSTDITMLFHESDHIPLLEQHGWSYRTLS